MQPKTSNNLKSKNDAQSIRDVSTVTDMIAIAEVQISTRVDALIAHANLPKNLEEAVRHSTLGGGKRVRPALCAAAYQTCQGCLENENNMWLAATAVELIHCYSLIHDDLPCMDDDALRRGKPTCHVVYGEATALLAGDLLQAFAFELIAQIDDSNLSFKLTRVLSKAARRMVVGQMRDLNAENQDGEFKVTQPVLEKIHQDKTGALIESAVLMGGLCANANKSDMETLQTFAQNLGLAFQVQDDILDITASTEILGKPVGSDDKLGKATYPRLMGLEAASSYAKQLFTQAQAALTLINSSSQDCELQQLAEWLWARQF